MLGQDLKQLLLDIFYPQRCVECATVLQDGTLFCPNCRKNFRHHSKQAVNKITRGPLEATGYFYSYTKGLRQAFHQVKYGGAQELLPQLAGEASVALGERPWTTQWSLSQPFCVVPIPTEPGRRLERGYDIPAEIFQPWCEKNKVTFSPCLERKAGISPQYGLTKDQRRANVRNSFVLRGELPGTHIVVVDDILTTGATLEEAAKVLKLGGAAKVWGLCFCGGEDK